MLLIIEQPLFGNHELSPVHNGAVPFNTAHPFWLLAVLAIVTSLVIITRIFYRKNISELTRAFMSLSVTSQLVREENIMLKRTSLMLTIIFYLTAAILVWQFGSGIAQKFSFALSDFSRFLMFALIIALVYSLKYVILKLAGFIFETDAEMDAYIFNIFLSNNLLGMVLFPVAVLLFLYPGLSDSTPVFIGIIAIAAMFFLYRILRGILIGRTSSAYSAVYLFLYICALEFAPLLVLLKLVAPQ